MNPNWSNALRQNDTQLTVVPLPSPVPSLGPVGANSKYLDTGFGTTILRATDLDTEPGNGPNWSWETNDSGASFDQIWNADGTVLRIINAGSGSTRLMVFDPINFRCNGLIANSTAPVGAVWDPLDPDVDYILKGTQVSKRTIVEQSVSVNPVSEPFFDFRVCTPIASIALTWHSPLQISDDSSLFSVSFSDLGGQDTGEWVVVYQPATGFWQTWNTLTGVVTGNGFPSGMISIPQRFSIHEMVMGPSGICEVAHGKTCINCVPGGPFLWKVGQLNAYQPTVEWSGHSNPGWSKWANANGPMVWLRDWNNPSVVQQISKSPHPWPGVTDQHMCWRADVLETYPILQGSSTVNAVQPLQITAPLQQELYLVNMDGSFSRIAHTFTSGVINSFNFRSAYAICSKSRQGYIAWSSDWMGTLGNTPKGENRSDVFIVVPGQ